MAKIVVHNEQDPQIAIMLGKLDSGGLFGTCTECPFVGQWSTQGLAVQRAQRHVDSHEPVVIGGDRDSLVR